MGLHNERMARSRHGRKSGKPFPGALLRTIKDIFGKSFGNKLKKGEVFKIDGVNYGNEFVLMVGIYLEAKSSTHFYASIDHQEGIDLEKSIKVLIDGLGHFLGEYFSRRKRVAQEGWQEVKMDDVIFYVLQEV